MIPVLQILAALGIVLTGFAVLLGAVPPGEAIKRIAGFVVIVLIAPIAIAILIRCVVVPGLAALWTAAKPMLAAVGAISILMLLIWIILAILEFRAGGHS
jgi:hypothetical protein